MTLIVFGGLAIVLFGMAYLTRRRFGVLGLALAAGSLISSLWAAPLVDIIARNAPELASITVAGYVAAGLVLLPAVLLLFSGPAYRGSHGRLLGAVLFTLFALILVAKPLGAALVLDGTGRAIYDWIQQYQTYILTVGVILSVLDLLAVHAGGGYSGKSKH